MIGILLVDDESYVTESLAQTIHWEALEITDVYQASSADEALQMMSNHSIDIVVTDIRMPDRNGLELVEIISARWPETRSVLLTGHSDFEYAKKALQLGAHDFLLKPVVDEEFMSSISNIVSSLRRTWTQHEQYQQLLYNMKSNMEVLRSNFMLELLLGRRISQQTLRDKLSRYEISFPIDAPAVMMLVHLNKAYPDQDHHSTNLMEYAVGNIAEEMFGSKMHVWYGKAPHDCLVILVTPKADHGIAADPAAPYERITEGIDEFQRNVSSYLKLNTSLVISEWFTFPREIADVYLHTLNVFYQLGQRHTAVIYTEDQQREQESSPRYLERLYKPPTFNHLLESKQWDAAKEKMTAVFTEMEETSFTRAHLYEVYLSVTNALMYMTHKQGQFIYQIDQSGFNSMVDRSMFSTMEHLRDWVFRAMDTLQSQLSNNDEHTKSYMIQQVQDIVMKDYGQSTSVKTLAERVFLHPVYLSKIYKAETGESLGDYIIRIRMERAHYLLKHSNKKIYEITSELGYQNPQYFSKMFKKYYGLTPLEFRDV